MAPSRIVSLLNLPLTQIVCTSHISNMYCSPFSTENDAALVTAEMLLLLRHSSNRTETSLLLGKVPLISTASSSERVSHQSVEETALVQVSVCEALWKLT